MIKRAALAVFLAGILASSLFVSELKAEEYTLNPIADAFVKKAAPTQNAGASPVLWNSYYETDMCHSYLVFELPGNIGEIDDAEFTASFLSKGGSPYVSILLLGITDDKDWDVSSIKESQLTWSNAPHREPFVDIASMTLEPGMMSIAGGVPHYVSSGWNPFKTQPGTETKKLIEFLNKAIKRGKKHVTFVMYVHPRGKRQGAVNYKSRESDNPPTLYIRSGQKRQEPHRIKNGSFEKGLVHWRQWWPRGRTGTLELDRKIGRSGRQCARVTMSDAKGSRLSLSQSVNIDPKQTYELSFSFYTRTIRNINATVRIGAFDENNQHIGYYCKKSLSPTVNVWVDHNLTFIPPANARKVSIEFNFSGEQECWLDHVSFSGVSPDMQKKLAALNKNAAPLFKELLIPGSAPSEPRLFPYWGYNNSSSHYRNVALCYGWQYSLSEQYKECAEHNLAPFSTKWIDKRFIDEHSVPRTCYVAIAGGQKCWKESIERGAQAAVGSRPNPNDPVFIETCIDNVIRGLVTETPPPAFYFFYDEMFGQCAHVLEKEKRTSEYWKGADALVKEKYGFGRIGIPDSTKDSNPFKWIAYLRWQADLAVETYRRVGSHLKKISPQSVLLGPDEFATFCPLDWERMGQVIDIPTGQTLSTSSGYRKFNAGYLVKFHRDLTGKPVYPFIQLTKYGASPSIDTVYDWVNQTLRNGGEGVFVGAVEWFDRYLNHPKYAAPRKWKALMGIVDRLQRMEKVRLPGQGDMALHFSSYTQMTRHINADQTTVGSAYSLLGPRAKSWFTFTDDFQIDRDIKRWDAFKVVVIPDAKYVSSSMMEATKRFVQRGGTLIVTDPEAFSFRIDGTKLDDFQRELFGVEIRGQSHGQSIAINGKRLFNPGQSSLKLNLCDRENLKVMARFKDGSAAIVEHRVGKGKVWYFAFNTNTDAAVDDIHWIEQWRQWLQECGIPLDYDIWRFEIPKQEVVSLPEYSYQCLTGNAIQFERNFPNVSMNVGIPNAVYSYKMPPKAIREQYEGDRIPFAEGLLTNRRENLELKKNSAGTPLDTSKTKIENWVVRFGKDECEPNSIVFDLAKPSELRLCRIVFSGQLPQLSIEGSLDNSSWTRITSIESQDAGSDVLMAKAKLSGRYRYVRLAFAPRKIGTELTLAEIDLWGGSRQGE